MQIYMTKNFIFEFFRICYSLSAPSDFEISGPVGADGKVDVSSNYQQDKKF